ncbi:unnamed protein product [Prunus brigantina]
MDTMDEIRVDLLPSYSIYFIVGIINKKLDVNQFQNVHSCRSGLSDSCLGLLKRGIQVPVSTAEIALKNLGGRLTAINQLMIISGVSISFKNGVLESWRALAFIGLVPCAVTIFGLFFIPESPRWLVVLGEEIDHVRLITLNRPRHLNVISSKVVSSLAEYLEKWEKDDKAELGSGRAFSAGGDLKMFYDGRNSKDSCLEVAYRMYWLGYHIHTYKKTQVALVHGISMGGGASLMVPMKFSVVTEKIVFASPEASIGFHTDCGFSYVSHLPGHLGEFFALTGARLNGKELVAAGLENHFVPLEKLSDLEKRLISLNSGDENAVKAAIEEFAVEVQPDEESVLNKYITRIRKGLIPAGYVTVRVGLALGELRKENNFLRSLWPVTNPPSSQEHLLHPQLLQKPLHPFLA